MADKSLPQDPQRAGELARDPESDAQILSVLTTSPLAFVREAALSNPSTPLPAAQAAVPRALSSEAEVGIARAVAAREDAPAALLEQLVTLLPSDRIDGSRRENWPYEQLAATLLANRNMPESAVETFLASVKLPKRLRALVLSERAGATSSNSKQPSGGA